MVSTVDRFVVRFAVHLPPAYPTNFLAELIEYYPATTCELQDGTFEIVSQKRAKTEEILGALRQEESRGSLVIEELP